MHGSSVFEEQADPRDAQTPNEPASLEDHVWPSLIIIFTIVDDFVVRGDNGEGKGAGRGRVLEFLQQRPTHTWFTHHKNWVKAKIILEKNAKAKCIHFVMTVDDKNIVSGRRGGRLGYRVCRLLS